jgi:hypothetical protein
MAMNNNAYALVTEMAVSVTAFRGTSKNGNWFRTNDIVLVNRVSSGASVRYQVVSVINNASWLPVTVAFVSGAGAAFATNDEVAVSVRGMTNPANEAPADNEYYLRQNNAWVNYSLVRDPTSTVFNWVDTTTMVNPGTGNIKGNTATLSTVTQLAISDTDFLGVVAASNLFRAKVYDEIMLIYARTGAGAARYVITAIAANAGWFLLTVVNIAGTVTDPSTNDKLAFVMLGANTPDVAFTGQRLLTANGTALLSDAGGVVIKTTAATSIYTIDTTAVTGWLPNTKIILIKGGANTFTVAPVSGAVVINSLGGLLTVGGPVAAANQNSVAQLYKSGTSDNWYLSGNLT